MVERIEKLNVKFIFEVFQNLNRIGPPLLLIRLCWLDSNMVRKGFSKPGLVISNYHKVKYISFKFVTMFKWFRLTFIHRVLYRPFQYTVSRRLLAHL